MVFVWINLDYKLFFLLYADMKHYFKIKIKMKTPLRLEKEWKNILFRETYCGSNQTSFVLGKN